jgi:hypothetical protein
MAQQIQLRNDSAAAWEAENPVLAQAEVGVNTTTGQFKIGNGTSTWEELEYYAGGSANVADFVFSVDDDGAPSRMTVTDHDMTIETVRDNDAVGSDCDINIQAADDVFIRAYGDEIGIYASSEVTIQTNSYDGSGNSDNQGPVNGAPQGWTFRTDGRIEFPDGTLQTTGNISPVAHFLTWGEGTTHLPDLNTHFGWNSDGLWFQNAQGSSPITSYPIFTDFTIPEDASVAVEFIFNANTECNNIGVCVYSDGDNPEWDYATNSSRIAAQFDCFDLKLYGRTTSAAGEVGIPGTGLYRVRFAYDPTASTDKVTVSYTAQGSEEVIESISINEALPAGPYRIGFAADQDSSSTKTYMTYMSINVNDGGDNYGAELDTGNSGTISDTDLVLPVAIKDDNGEDFITFTRTYTGTARIDTPQDDLSLRSARDITLYAGNDGPGNVYIGWGDAEFTPDSPNRVATIGDVQAATGLGDITFDGVQIIGGGTASGDGYGYSTIELVPDADLIAAGEYSQDQYLIIDPTSPNHIHIRAGGVQDESTAQLIIGAEKTNLKVVDNGGIVQIATSYNNNIITLVNESAETSSTLTTNTNYYPYGIIDSGWSVTNSENVTVQITGTADVGEGIVLYSVDEADFFIPDGEYRFRPTVGYDGDVQWTFNPDGVLAGPEMGGLKVLGITNAIGQDLNLYANDSNVVISADEEIILSTNSGDIYLDADGGVYIGNSNNSYDEVARVGDLGEDTAFAVVGGALGDAPTFDGDPLFTGSYVKTGPMVHFRIDVDMDNITDFGSGQYYVDLPFPAKYNYHFRNACLHDVSMPRQFGLSGHVFAGESRVTLFYTDTSGQDVAFDYNSPALLTTSDNFHIAGDYIADTEG